MRTLARMALMDEPPQKTADETNEDLIREWDLYYASRAKEMGALSVSDYELVLHRMAKRQARRTKRLPPRSITPPPMLGAALPSPGKDEPCVPATQFLPSPSEVPADPPVNDAEMTPEKVAELEAKADRAVDRALTRPIRARS